MYTILVKHKDFNYFLNLEKIVEAKRIIRRADEPSLRHVRVACA